MASPFDSSTSPPSADSGPDPIEGRGSHSTSAQGGDRNRATSFVIAPSILAADFARLSQEARRAEKGGGDWLHVDVMDGHFVPNISLGPVVTAALKRSTCLPLDVHLMIDQPDRYIEAFREAGAWRITVHVEAHHPIRKTLGRIRRMGCRAGIALNPATDFHAIEDFLSDVDLVLCMTVVPGFGGQKFMPAVLKKIRALAEHPARQKHNYWIEVDGGINMKTAVACARAGANAFVSGTALFQARNMTRAVAEMRRAVRQNKV